MIKKCGNFIQATDGSWHNIHHVCLFYVGGDHYSKYRICFSYQHEPHKFAYFTIGDPVETQSACQKELDELMEKFKCK